MNADCFTILEYLAETISNAGKRRTLLLEKMRQHLRACPGCHNYYLQKLAELERLNGNGSG